MLTVMCLPGVPNVRILKLAYNALKMHNEFIETAEVVKRIVRYVLYT